MRSTLAQTAVSAIGSASIAKPGLTPVPSTATFAFFAQASICRACRTCVYPGYASSSVVVTMAVFDLRMVSICGITFLIDELVHSTTMCGFAAFNAVRASPDTLTLSRFGKPTTSPRSRPTLAGSMSIPPTILNPGRVATCLTMAAPIGPSPK